jgi:hypothetical protein
MTSQRRNDVTAASRTNYRQMPPGSPSQPDSGYRTLNVQQRSEIQHYSGAIAFSSRADARALTPRGGMPRQAPADGQLPHGCANGLPVVR